MQNSLWKECLTCKDKCCKWHLAFPLFLTEEEKKQLPNTNKNFPCVFFNQKELCDIHDKRPFDCRFFPFDIHKKDGKFFWIIWKVACPILEKQDYEPYLQEHEAGLIPKFKQYLDEYAKFRLEWFLKNFEYEVLREIIM